ncbi:MAG: neuraminidase-like domain-containing protein, partial [Cyanobacteria bacterium J06635_15]
MSSIRINRREGEFEPEPGIPAPGKPAEPIARFLELKVNITSPKTNDRRSKSVTVNGSVTCNIVEIFNSGQDKRTNAINRVTKVDVKLGSGSFRRATATGPSNQWSSWTLTGNASNLGSMKITARVTANDIGFNPGTKTDTDDVTVVIEDKVKPSVSISSGSSTVTKPPYTATIRGTAADVGFGVKRVEWRLNDSGSFKLATKETSTWSKWKIVHNLPGLGTHKFTVRAVDKANNISSSVTRFVEAKDATKPSLTVKSPPDNHRIAIADGSAIVPLTGTASDTETGVAVVEWRIDDDPFQAADTSNDWATWTANVVFPRPDDYTIEVRARDQAGNLTPSVQRQVVVTSSFEPNDPLDVVSPTVYLEDLINLVNARVDTAVNGQPVTAQLLTTSFYQPFEALIKQAFSDLIKQPIPQIRVCVEVLRQHLTKLGKTLPDGVEQQYRLQTYQTLLQQFGVSLEELRLARVADQATREALANRLGFALDGSRPDPLDQLLLSPDQLTEAFLEAQLGLLATTHNLGELAIAPDPQLLLWQLEHIQSLWQQQDANAERPIIDPDLFVAEDFQTQSAESVAFSLWQARRQQVSDRLNELQAAQKAAAETDSDRESFEQLISEAIAPIEDLVALATAYQQGEDIVAQLTNIQLSLQPFLKLIQLLELTQADQLLQEEWETTFAILIQVMKLRQYDTWQVEEQQAGLILSPKEFALVNGSISLPAERASQQARNQWQKTLTTRIDQEQAIIQTFAAAVNATEAITLPVLRDALITAVDAERALPEVANQLSRELLIDMQNGGDQKTTRIELAIAALQEVLFAVRTDRFATGHPAADWVLHLDEAPAKPEDRYGEAEFDEEMQWMGTYATWRAAMFVFGYPENYLLPNLRPAAEQSDELKTLVNNLRGASRLTPARARELAIQYFSDLDDSSEPIGDTPKSRLQAILNPLQGNKPTAEDLQPTDEITEVELAQRHDHFKLLFDKAGYAKLQDVPTVVVEVGYSVPLLLASYLQRAGQYVAALDWFQTVYAYNLPIGQRKVYAGLSLEKEHENRFDRALDWLLDDFNPHTIANERNHAHTHYTIALLVSCLLDFADAEFTRDSNEAITKARSLYLTALGLLDSPDMQPLDADSPFPPNPVITSLKLHAETNLQKIRSGRNIAGLDRQSQFESADNSSFSG